MSRLTQGPRNPCTWQLRLLCSTTLRTANFQEQMGRGSSSKRAQVAYNESNCIHTFSGFFVNTTQSSYRRCVLLHSLTRSSKIILHILYMPVGSVIGSIYIYRFVSMATSIFRVAQVGGMVDSIAVEWRRRTRKNVLTLLLASLSERHVYAI